MPWRGPSPSKTSEAQNDARVGGLDQHRELLDDPDPARRLAAVQVMVDSRSRVTVGRPSVRRGLLYAAALGTTWKVGGTTSWTRLSEIGSER